MEQFRLILVGMIWWSLGLCLVSGIYYGPNFRRADKPKAYWAAMGTSAVAGVIMTIIFLRG